MRMLTSFQGRMDRAQFWTGVLTILALALIAGPLLRVTLAESALGFQLAGAAVAALAIYAWAAVLAKRLRDLGMPRMPRLAIFVGGPALLVAARLTGIGFAEERVEFGMANVEGALVQSPNLLGQVIVLVAIVSVAWAVLDCGLRRGQKD